jgi:hypothetical protein
LIRLDAHLRTQKILSAWQIDKYDELRGYKKLTGGGASY